MIGGDLNSDVILCCHDSSRPISRAHPASAMVHCVDQLRTMVRSLPNARSFL